MKTLGITTQSYSRNQILYSQPDDVGTILQKFSGTTIKSYGGLGGLKTVSVRGLGNQHTTFLIDGFTIHNTQTGQVNLGQIQTDNVENLTLSLAGRNGFLLPVSSYISGSVVTINSFENNRSNEFLKIRYCSRFGSFGEKDNYFSTKISGKNIFFSVFSKYRQANGKYSYTLKNGAINYDGIRLNNDLIDWYSGATFGAKFKNNAELRILYKTNGANQGLPGAVILYNDIANQRLRTVSQQLNIDIANNWKTLSYRLFGSYNRDWMKYTDPSFLNNIGGISNVYINNSIQIGTSAQYEYKVKTIIFGGVESRYSDLNFMSINSASPKRLHNFALLGFNFNHKKWSSEFQLSAQGVIEENSFGERAPNKFKISPFVAFETNEWGKWKVKLKVWYRNSFRMPSFNELYYNNIGNINLKPEEANQFSIGGTIKPIQNKFDMLLTFNGFANKIENQILAIPTKNLFVWSMQNIGRVTTFGYETRVRIEKCFRSFWYSDVDLNYTYQYSVDITDRNSPTYLNQVAYIPRHTGNLMFTIKRKNSGLQLSNYLCSLRYSLMENVESNKVEGFQLVDLGLFSKINLKKSQSIRIQFTVKNLFNSNYAYIRYFIMPGRNYLLTLNYAFN